MAKALIVAILFTLTLASESQTPDKAKLLISFVMKTVAGAWCQPRGIDAMNYICTDVVPVLPLFLPASFTSQHEAHWSSLCAKVEDAVNSADGEFDAVDLCHRLSADLKNLRKMMPSSRDLDWEPNSFREVLLDVIKDIYSVDPSMDFTGRCEYAEQALIPSIPAQVTEVTTRFIVASMPQGQEFLCDNWDEWRRSKDHEVVMNKKMVKLAIKALGFRDRAAVCEEMGAAITQGESGKKKFADTVVEELHTLFTDSGKCAGTVHEIVRTLELEDGIVGSLPVLGFASIDDLCVKLTKVFAPCESRSGKAKREGHEHRHIEL